MLTITQFAGQHPFALLTMFWLFSNAVSTMPSPNGKGWTSGVGYQWLFNFLHAASGTVGRILAQYPATQKLTGQISEPNSSEEKKP